MEQKRKVIKYHICPGFIASKIDDEFRFVDRDQLAKLYGLKRTEWMRCTCILAARWAKNIKHLYPRNDGDYKLGTRKNNHA